MLVLGGALLGASAAAREPSPNRAEVARTLSQLTSLCAANEQKAVEGAVARINAMPERSSAAPIAAHDARSFIEAYARISAEPAHEDERALARAAIDGMLHAVDDQAGYWHSSELRSDPGRIGISLRPVDGGARVIGLAPGGPGERAGIFPGDVVESIDGRSTVGAATDDLSALARGPVDSSARIVIRRAGQTAAISVEVRREAYGAVHTRRNGSFGVIAVGQLAQETTHDVQRAVREMQDAGDPVRGFVLDIRNNQGGLLDEAVRVADIFMGAAVVGSVASAGQCPPAETQLWHSRGGDEANGAPLVVLINEGTASGAEMLAAALIESRRAIAIGQTTARRANVDTIIPLAGGSGGLIRIKTGEILTPSGVRLTGRGVEPTIAVPESDRQHDYALESALEYLGQRIAR
jgi:carboxyl-terminal processing protease